MTTLYPLNSFRQLRKFLFLDEFCKHLSFGTWLAHNNYLAEDLISMIDAPLVVSYLRQALKLDGKLCEHEKNLGIS